MLILTRRAGESLYIGENIKLVILSTHSENGKVTVSVGIDAPKDMNILREEVKLRNEQGNFSGKTGFFAYSGNGDKEKGSVDVRSKGPRGAAQKLQGQSDRRQIQKPAQRDAEKDLGKGGKPQLGNGKGEKRLSAEARQDLGTTAIPSLLDVTFESARQAIDNLAQKAK